MAAAAIMNAGMEALKPGGIVEQSALGISDLIAQHQDQLKVKRELEGKIKELEDAIKEAEQWFKNKGVTIPTGGSGIIQMISGLISKLSKKGHDRRNIARAEKIAKLQSRLAFLAEQKKAMGGSGVKYAKRSGAGAPIKLSKR